MYQPSVNTSPSRKKIKDLFGSVGYQQEQTTPPPSPPPSTSPLGALAKKVGGEKEDVKKVTIVGGGGGAGDKTTKKTGPGHGEKHPYHQEAGVDTMVWDSVKKTWVRRGVLSPAPDKVVIDTAPSKKKPEK